MKLIMIFKSNLSLVTTTTKQKTHPNSTQSKMRMYKITNSVSNIQIHDLSVMVPVLKHTQNPKKQNMIIFIFFNKF